MTDTGKGGRKTERAEAEEGRKKSHPQDFGSTRLLSPCGERRPRLGRVKSRCRLAVLPLFLLLALGPAQ